MEKKMETTIVYWGYVGDNGKENGKGYNGKARGQDHENDYDGESTGQLQWKPPLRRVF